MTPEEYYKEAQRLFKKFSNKIDAGINPTTSAMELKLELMELLLKWNSVIDAPQYKPEELKMHMDSIDDNIGFYIDDFIKNRYILSMNSSGSLLRTFDMPDIIEDMKEIKTEDILAKLEGIKDRVSDIEHLLQNPKK